LLDDGEQEYHAKLMEAVAEQDDELMEKYLSEGRRTLPFE
jgi:translation elongation factor EF-G